ncbi:CC0125/CC1285 family lipoprotein [Maricaulis parjimensis]|uniref:CC0125/CC1285 family lipoprotein n=1 Tax=Maricaulis parjimensis TaxID=144023 RepID=UPI00193931C1|nr:hypothetical protein [Maricaulis parjimensis]
MRRILIGLTAAATLAACATPTPYQAADGGRSGYSQTQIESNRFRISFRGNSLTDRETTENYLLYRAAELTVENGYDYFTVVTRATDEDTRVTGTGIHRSYYSAFPVHYTYYHPRWGWRGWRDPFWDDLNYREITRYEASAEIFMGRGERPDDPEAFDARDVMGNLGSEIIRPEAD